MVKYNDAPQAVDPYSDAYNAPPPAPSNGGPPADDARSPRGRSRSRSPRANGNGGGDYARSPPPRPRSPPARKANLAPTPEPSNVLGVFGLSIRTQERDLDEEFSKFGRVTKVTIVYDQRSDRSRGFGFIEMATVEDATRCIEQLNGVELNGRRIRVDFSVTDRAHAPTPGQYMGHRRSGRDSGREPFRPSYRDKDRDHDRRDYRDRDRDSYGRDRDSWRDRDRDSHRDRDMRSDRDRDRDRRSPAPRRHSPDYRSRRRSVSPDYRRRRSYSRSPPPRGASPGKDRDHDRDRW